MKLPNGNRAVVDVKKLQEYCLSPTHPQGKHKARLFSASLGLISTDSEYLRAELLKAAGIYDAIPTRDNGFGQLFKIEFEMTFGNRRARILSIWIVLKPEDFARLVTCYPI
jgi:hypothetical protein